MVSGTTFRSSVSLVLGFRLGLGLWLGSVY